MPFSISTHLQHLSSKLPNLFHIRSHLNRNRRSPPNDLPITRFSFHHTHGRHLTRDETEIAYTQAQGDQGAARGPAFNSATTISSSSGNARARRWSWANSDDFSVARMTPTTMDESDQEPEEWREEWDEIRMSLKEVAKARPMITIVGEDEPWAKHDSGYCEYDYAAVLTALRKPESGTSQEQAEGSRAAFRRVFRGLKEIALVVREEEGRRREEVAVDYHGRDLRQIALEVSDEEEEEGYLAVRSADIGSMRTRDGEVACGDVWW